MSHGRTVFSLAAIVAAFVLFSGCDPKLTDTDDGSGTPTAPTPDETSEASAVGAVVALHMDLITAGLSKSGDFDSASPLTGRSIFTDTGCIVITTTQPSVPEFDLRLDTCVDVRGTAYRGGAVLFPIEGFDGFYIFPYGAAEDKIIATNDANDELNHTFDSGNFQMMFVRSGAEVTGVDVQNFVRHVIRGKTATFSYDGVRYNGGIGSHAAYPASGGVIHVAWDSVGVFDVEFSGSSSVHFVLGGWRFRLDLSSGNVTYDPA